MRRRVTPLPQLPEGTSAEKWIASITSLSDPEEARRLGQLSGVEKTRISDLQKQLTDVHSADPRKTAQALQLKATRIERLLHLLQRAEYFLGDSTIIALFESRARVREAKQAVLEAQHAISRKALDGTGSNLWRRLWEAARGFSIQHAYPDQHFPVVGIDARCVLCQQTLDDAAIQRLSQFEEHVRSVAQQELEKANEEYDSQSKLVRELDLATDEFSSTTEELAIEDEELAQAVTKGVRNADALKQFVLSALDEDKPLTATLPNLDLRVQRVSDKVQELRGRSMALLQEPAEDREKSLLTELQELEARAALGEDLNSVITEINRRKRLAAYEVCLRDTDTRGITRKSSEVTEAAVTGQLTTSFKGELLKLGLGTLRVDLKAIGGSRGALYHQLVLTDAASVRVAQVASEGEARVLSLASFFAELTTASDASAILFDDPVSSLDHQWRDNVARRLAEEAGARQVVVFTHDVVSLLALVHWADGLGVDCKHQHVRKEALGAGVSSSQLPWVAMSVKKRIGVLNDMWQRAEKLHRTATREKYEREAVYIYGRLRETWERALEEVLLGGVVERFRNSVESQRVRHLSDITDEDCSALGEGMTKSSRWLAGHDQAAAENVSVPNPDELQEDISALEVWVSRINRRRKSR